MTRWVCRVCERLAPKNLLHQHVVGFSRREDVSILVLLIVYIIEYYSFHLTAGKLRFEVPHSFLQSLDSLGCVAFRLHNLCHECLVMLSLHVVLTLQCNN